MRLSLITLAAASVIFLTSCGEQKKSNNVVRPVLAIKVKQTSEFPRRSFPGKAKAVEEANLAFGVDGTLDKLPIKVGDEVKKDSIIASLNQRDFISKLNAARAELTRNEKNLQRANELVKKDFISKSEFDRIFAATQMSRSKVEVAKKALEDSTITAPFDGVITNKFVDNFESVRAKQVIARILDIAEIEMIVQIPESLISRINRVSTVSVVYDAYPLIQYVAKIKEVGREASRTTRTFPVTLIMPQQKAIKILPGMAGVARVKDIKGDVDNKKILIPVNALFTPSNQKQSHVWVVIDNKVQMKPVEVANLTSQGVFIKSGLNPGEIIVIAGVNSLQKGQTVSLMLKNE
jgi:membrane fusion protein, multidrug efflux system